MNPDNPLGYNATIAKAYAGLVNQLYIPDQTSFGPRNFKNTLGRAQPLFSGYGQQDSQEFISFLMDGLHEDLNRIKKKPYMENPDSDDKTVHDPEAIRELGEKYRENHRARNDSVAMDLFNGFYKNTMVCPVCDKVSVTFDPFSQVTLQLPVENTFQHQIFVAPLHGSPKTINVDIDKNQSIKGLKEYVARKARGLKTERLVVAEEYSEKFYKIFEDGEVLSEASIQHNDVLWCFELDQSPTNWPPVDKKKSKANRGFTIFGSSSDSLPDMDSPFADRMAVPILHRRQDGTRFRFGLTPSFILITREEAKDFDSILRKVLQRIQTMTTRDILEGTEDSRSDAQETEESRTEAGSEQGNPRIQAESVDGDDELVDVSMTNDGTSTPQESATEVRDTSKKSRILDPAYFIDNDIRRWFTLKIYSSNTDIVPTNYTGLSETDRLPSLESRIPQSRSRSNRRGSNVSRNSRLSRWGRPESPMSSDDELGNGDHEQSSRASSPAVSDDDSSYSPARRPNKPGAIRRFGSKLKAHSRPKKNSQRSSSTDFGHYLLRLGEGLVLDWDPTGYDQLFGGNSEDDMRGIKIDPKEDVVADPELDQKKARRAARKKSGVTLDECFTETAKSEILSEENAWYCNRCKQLRRASKTLELWTVPDILVVHLKRFSSASRWRDKVEILVDFPIEGLNLTGKVGLPEDKSLVYDLFAVDNHYGSLGGGHYTAYAKNYYDGKWYDYNDAWVTSISPDAVVSKSAYLLFYRRRSNGPLGPTYLQKLVAETGEPGESQSPSPTGQDESLSAPHQSDKGALILRDQANNEKLPSYQDHKYDEGISMDDDERDNAVPTSEQAGGFIGPMRQTWTWDNLGQQSALPAGNSDNEDTLSLDAGGGSDMGEKMMQDFGDDEAHQGLGYGKRADPGFGDEPIEHVGVSHVDDDEAEVAEIPIGSDEEVGP